MLSSDLLRTKISKNTITPLFCSLDFGNSTPYELANKLVTFFENTHKNGTSKGELLQKITLLESEYDYKLVRGLCTLLERRSIFESGFHSQISPKTIRQNLFKESSVQGFALSDVHRQKIIKKIADQNDLSTNEIEKFMWADMEENLILKKFNFINPKHLLLWYNLSLTQTLLFRCTTMEFSIEGGLYWKQVLRNVKRYGLMYTLDHQYNESQQDLNSINCTLEGPLSLFKMTDKYGTSMAKLLPWIIKAPVWRINGSIIRKNDEGSKIYKFEMSSTDKNNTSEFLQPISEILFSNNYSKINNSQIHNHTKSPEDDFTFDSLLEKNFEKLFLQYFNKKDDWKISREPNPLIVDGKAMIPDFLFERFGKKVYFEIVGFWTKEYLARKTAKLRIIFDRNQQKEQDIYMIVGVNSDLACSEIESISDDHVFVFKKAVPIKPILKHLEKIDKKIIEEKSKNTEIQLDIDNIDIISIESIARKYCIPNETVLNLLSSKYQNHLLIGKLYLISEEKINHIQKSLIGIQKFTQACNILEKNKIPEFSHADLLSQLNYDVIWKDLDPNNAIITKKIP